MAKKYHVNPRGDVSECHAQQSCPFGDMEKDHYPTKWEGMKAYEEK